MSLTGTTITLAGIAATPAHSTTARAALAGLEGVDTVVALDVLDPGIVDFQLRYDAATGFRLDGTVPELPGRDGFSVALGGVTLDGIGDTTFATVNGLDTVLAGLAAYLASLDRADLSGTNAGLRVLAQPMAGLDAGTIERLLADALGPTAELSILPSQAPKAGDERRNTATGRVQFAAGGVWLNRPEFEPTGSACTAAARATVEAAPIRFQTGTADLDPASLHTINEVAGIVHHCTQAPGARVTIGGHTDSEGNDAANYALSVARAKAVRDALWDRGVPATRMMPIGYGETEPIAANETAEGRARNRRISFEWPE